MTTHTKISLILGTIVLCAAAGAAISNQYGNSPKRPSSSSLTLRFPARSQTSGDATSSPSDSSKTYTMNDIAMHNSATSCWTTINGGVYDVTSWINQHPGGRQAIIGLCGIDGSDAFNGQHGGQARPAAELASFKIGTLAQ